MAVHKKWFRAKNSIFGPQKGHFGQSGPRNGPSGGQTATYQKTEGIQSYFRIWGTYDPIESQPFELKKWGFHRCSLKMQNFGPKMQFFCPKSIFLPKASNFFVTIMTGQQKDNIFVLTLLHGGPRGGRRGPILARKSAFFYATPT